MAIRAHGWNFLPSVIFFLFPFWPVDSFERCQLWDFDRQGLSASEGFLSQRRERTFPSLPVGIHQLRQKEAITTFAIQRHRLRSRGTRLDFFLNRACVGSLGKPFPMLMAAG